MLPEQYSWSNMPPIIIWRCDRMKNVDKYRYRCKHCKEVIAPDGQGTMIWCGCGSVAVDGKYDRNGEGYCRVLGNPEDYEELKRKRVNNKK